MNAAQMRTVSDWRANGYRGLRIMRCPECRCATDRTWEQLSAEPGEDVVARRIRCDGCEKPPAGLAILAYKEAA